MKIFITFFLISFSASLYAADESGRPSEHFCPTTRTQMDGRSAAYIASRIQEEFTKNAWLIRASRGQHIVAILGNTGSGKTTLANLLTGIKVILGQDGAHYVLENPKQQGAMSIAETFYPNFVNCNGVCFFDSPGFNYTDGSEHNLVNAAFMRAVLLEAASVKLIFVVGQDEFTADRGASINHMFNSIKQLFVTQEQGKDLVSQGILVVTKVTYAENTDIPQFLLRGTNSQDKEALKAQLQGWSSQKRLFHMFSPVRRDNTVEIRDSILACIRDTRGEKISRVNVIVLLPPETETLLENAFFHFMQETFQDRCVEIPKTLSEHDEAIDFCESPNFWVNFENVVASHYIVALFKYFNINLYMAVFEKFRTSSEEQRISHIQELKIGRYTRIDDVKKITNNRIQQVIQQLASQHNSDEGFVFDHQNFFQQVCGQGNIETLATDPKEQEIVREAFAAFIVGHSHDQMMQRFATSGRNTERVVMYLNTSNDTEGGIDALLAQLMHTLPACNSAEDLDR